MIFKLTAYGIAIGAFMMAGLALNHGDLLGVAILVGSGIGAYAVTLIPEDHF